MAQFRGTVQGARGEASRLGHKATGLRTACRGWDAGVQVHAEATDDGGEIFSIYADRGSNSPGGGVYLGSLRIDADGNRRWSPETYDGGGFPIR